MLLPRDGRFDRGSRTLLAAGLLGVAASAAACGGARQPETTPAPAPVPAVRDEPVVQRESDAPPVSGTSAWKPASARLLTRWGANVRADDVLPEYPRPQMTRTRWENLNGLWDFAIVDSSSTPAHAGDPYKLARPSVEGAQGRPAWTAAPESSAFTSRILVPFAPEAALSGVGRHADRVAYRRTFRTPSGMAQGERLLLHFGACDWQCTVYVNGREVRTHSGGYDAFSADVTNAIRPTGDQELVVAVYDPTDKFGQPRGKQVSRPEGIWYTPVTGIWQTVWLEPVPASSVEKLVLIPDVDRGALRLTVRGRGTTAGQRVVAVASAEGREVGRVEGAVGAELRLPVPNARLWGPDDPFLYDLSVVLREGTGESARGIDSVTSYFGMRKVGLMRDPQGRTHIALNGRRVFQLGPLDQGWWPDGLYTAPTDEALRSDIVTMKALGFNMVRKHIKVEPARWYYHADRLGLPVWQDMPSGWNDSPEARRHFERELRAMIDDLESVPSIVAWVPFNEKWGQFDVARMVRVVRSLDSSRVINDVSGWQHENVGDMVDVHRYQGPQAMYGLPGRASVVGEFGGLGFKVSGHAWAGDAWGYGGLFPSEEALRDRYDLLIKRMWHLRDTHGMSAGIYTQLTDVEVELNGYMTYDRAVVKFDTARTAAVNRGLAPYLLPELADFTDAVRVSITQGTPTEIRYTTDGSEPTAASALYRSPFTLRATTTVRARSFVNGAPTSAPEARTEYRRAAGRPPLRLAAGSTARGLSFEYYRDTTPEPAFRMNWPVRWQLERPEVKPEDVKPTRSGSTLNVSLAVADTNELFGLRFTGYLQVPRTGVYTLTAVSDDGAGLWVGEQNVFWSLGQSPKSTETAGQIALQAGLHPITVTYFQAYGPRALELYIEGPGMTRQRVPASMFYRDRAPRTAADRAATTP